MTSSFKSHDLHLIQSAQELQYLKDNSAIISLFKTLFEVMTHNNDSLVLLSTQIWDLNLCKSFCSNIENQK